MNIFPKLKKKHGGFEGKIILKEWDEYFHHKNKIDIVVGGEEGTDKVMECHTNTIQYLLDNAKEMLDVLLSKLMSEYPAIQKEFREYFEEEKWSEYLPDIATVDDFCKLIKPLSIFVFNTQKDNLCYVGFEFECTWEVEHGLGFMVYKDRVADFGGADSASMDWIAERDFEKQTS